MFQGDVVIVGGGLIGLACGTAVARTGLRTVIVSAGDLGAASPASAGILAPGVGNATGTVRALGVAARDMYPEFLEDLTLRTGIEIPLDRSGILEIALAEDEAERLRSSLRGGEWLDDLTLREREPKLGPTVGGVFHPRDGAVDVSALLEALRADAARNQRVTIVDGRATVIHADAMGALVELEDGQGVYGERVVLAAGAWVGAIRGLPRPLPVVPVRGQMLSLESPGMRHVVMGPRGYVVQRGAHALVGSTMESVGFDPRTTADGAALLRTVGAELLPSLKDRPILDHRAGLRPVTPDLLPIVGVDPECERVVYACGHSKNGVLLAPLTARTIADLLARGSSPVDIAPYAPDRFARSHR